MGAILPLHALIIHQAHVGLIHQGRRLEAMAGALAFHVAPRQAAQLVIDDRRQPVERASVSVTPSSEQQAHFSNWRRLSLMVVWLCWLPHCPKPFRNHSPLLPSVQEK